MNNFSLEEEQTENNYSRKLNLSFTDTAIDKVASVLGGYVPLAPSQETREVPHPRQKLVLPFSPSTMENEQSEEQEDLNGEVVEATSQDVTNDKSPSNYFEKDGQGFLMSKNPDYRGKDKKTQQERFILLYVWAYNEISKEPVPNKKHLSSAAQKNGIYSKNFSTYTNEISNRFFIKSDGTLKLNPTGYKEVEKVIAEMQDSDLKGMEYWSSTRRNYSQGSRTTREEIEQINQWLQKPSRFDSFDVRSLSNKSHLAILALYDITKELRVESAVKPALAYEYLVKRYEIVSATKKSFGETLAAKGNKKFFEKTPEGLYYLTQEAERLAENWVPQI